MSNKIKAGDFIECDGAMYSDYWIGQKVKVREDEHGLYVLGHKDARYRLHELSISKYTDEAFAVCVGYSFVKKKPEPLLRGSELTKSLLEKQKYVLCYVSDTNDGDCRENKRLSVIERFEDGYFYKDKVNGPFVCSWKCAVPVDMNGNEIMEIE